MKRLLKLVRLTPEGKILAALIEGPKNYSELKVATGLSDRWLSKKLRELALIGIIENRGGSYRLCNPGEIFDADPFFKEFLRVRSSLKAKARLIAEEIAHNKGVIAIILFGSVIKEKSSIDSDIDLVVVTEKEMEEELNEKLYNLMFKYEVPIEAIFLTYEDLLVNLQAGTTFSFGLLEGYQVLYDCVGVEKLLAIKKEEIEKNWIYDEESGAWIQKKLLPILRRQRSS